jgi:hypothetical protein
MMVLFLDIWSALVLGILYLSFGGLPYIFQTQYGLWVPALNRGERGAWAQWRSTVEQSGLCFLGIGLGQVLAVLRSHVDDFDRRHYRQIAARSPDGIAPPESRLIPGFFGVIACPLGLLLLGLLSFENVPWILPILGSLFFGVGMVYSFTSTFTYLVE